MPVVVKSKSLVAAAAMLAVLAKAEPVQWVGLGSNNLWDDAANWSPIKVPQPTDDVTLPANTNAMIGTSNGATANSVTIGDGSLLKVVGSNATFGLGGVQLNGNSVLHLDSGAYPFTSQGPLRIGGTSRLDWYSGSLLSEVHVGSGAALAVEGMGAHYATKDVFLSPSSALVVQGPVLVGFWGAIHNNGGLVHVNASGRPHITGINVTSSNGGKFNIDASGSANPPQQIQVDSIQANVLNLGVGISVQNNARLSNVVCADNAPVNFNGISYVSAWSGGQVMNGIAGTLYLSGKNRFTGLSSYGSLQCAVGDITTQALTVTKVLYVGHQCPVQSDSGAFGNDLFATGDGTISVGQSQWYGTIRLGQGLTYRAEKGLVFSGVNSVILDGELDIPTGSVLNSTSASPIVAVSILARPGHLNNNGSVVVTGVPRGAKLVLTYVTYGGSGSVSLVGNATLDVENLAFQPQSLAVGFGSKATGEGCSFGWGGLTGSAPGSRFSIIGDGKYEECRSPCPLRPGRPYQSFELVPEQ